MGIDISARLMYGNYYEEIIENLTEEEIEQFQEDLNDGEIEYASPYYDSDMDEWFVGYEMGECFRLEDVHTFVDELKEVEAKFLKRFKHTGNVQARQHVY